MSSQSVTRRRLLQGAGMLGAYSALERLLPSYARAQGHEQMPLPAAARASTDVYDLMIGETELTFDGRRGIAQTVNGTVPGPILRLREGHNAVIRTANRLAETASIHWHGLILPFDMDGVPGVSFAGIQPGTTFEYRFPVQQSGTFWYHSHSGGQELRGVYGPIIIDPIAPEPFAYDRDYVVMLSEWSFLMPETIMAKMKKQADYFNYQKRTVGEFFRDVRRNGWNATVDNYSMWARMRMDPTDFADVTSVAFTHLVNGVTPEANWTGVFGPGERVRLRFINAATMSIYDVRIPDLKMRVVQVDGQNVAPIEVDEFRIGVAETYDVIVEPRVDRAYTIFSETIDRSGFSRATLAPRAGMSAAIPARRPRPLRTMADMGMAHDMEGMEHAATPGRAHGAATQQGTDIHGPGEVHESTQHESMRHGTAMEQGTGRAHPANMAAIPGSTPVPHGADTHGPGNQAVPMVTRARLHEPGTGLENNGRRVLVYTDLRALAPYPDQRPPGREIEVHITGNMERQIWGFDGKKFSEASEPIEFHYNERLRLTLVNDTMMEHPIHLHGMWFHLENGHGAYLPRKHTILVKPAERVSLAITADAPGKWALHCHLLFHMEMGMFRVVSVVGAPPGAQPGEISQKRRPVTPSPESHAPHGVNPDDTNVAPEVHP